MKRFASALLLAGILALGTSACASEPDGVLLPYPQEGQQYRMSELCSHLEEGGYNVRGTLTHTIEAEDLGGLLDNLPSLARGTVENYLGDGITVQLEIRNLCAVLNRG